MIKVARFSSLFFFSLSVAFIRSNICSCTSVDKVLSCTTQTSVAVRIERLDSVVSPFLVGAGAAAVGGNASRGRSAAFWVG